jgi:hypothetical protein
MLMTRQALPTCVLLALAACSGSQDGDTTPPIDGDARQPAPSLGADPPVVPHSQLLDVLGRSVGDFLRLVEVEPEQHGGTFDGWRIARLPESMPGWLDIRQGDVVTAINRMPLEHPDQAQQVWESLRVSSEVLIELRRGDREFSIRIPIGEPEAAPISDGPAAPETASPPAE